MEVTTGHFFRGAKISYTESTEKAQRYTEMSKIGPYDEGAVSHG